MMKLGKQFYEFDKYVKMNGMDAREGWLYITLMRISNRLSWAYRQEGWFHASSEQVMKEAGITNRNTFYALKEHLIEKGLVQYRKEGARKGFSARWKITELPLQ